MGYLAWMPYVGVDEAKKFPDILFKLVAEMIGTMFLVLVGCGSCFGANPDRDGDKVGDTPDAAYVRIALCFGVTVATIAQSIGHISGCHINPAVTLGLFFGGKIGLINSILYIVAQLIGGLIGAGLLKVTLPIRIPDLENSYLSFIDFIIADQRQIFLRATANLEFRAKFFAFL